MKRTYCLGALAILAAVLVLTFGTGTAQETAPPKAAAPNPYDYAPSNTKSDADGCKQNLEKIAAAILAYRKDHKDIPNWLSDLVPQYLPAETLICPVTTANQKLSPYGALDPKLRCSYLFEFCPTPMTDIVRGAWPGPMMTNRQWKRQQMGLVGSGVPIVRCLMHEPTINLSFGGTVYESPMFWEEGFLDVVKREDLQPH